MTSEPRTTNLGLSLSGLMSRQFQLISLLFFFKALLDLVYLTYLDVEWTSHYLTPFLVNFAWPNFILSYIILIPIGAFTPSRKDDFKFAFAIVYLIFFLLPILTIFGLDSEREWEAMFLALFGYVATLSVASFRLFKVSLPVARNGQHNALVICFVGIGAFVMLSFVSGALNTFSLDLTQIYTLREESTSILDEGFFAYPNLWAQKVFTPFVLAVAFVRRNWILFGVAVALEIYFFGVTHHRQFLLIPFFVVGIILAVRSRVGLSMLFYLSGAAVALGWLAYVSVGQNELTAIVIRRAFFVPASVYLDWISFFQDFPHVFWTDRLLSGVWSTQYNGLSLPWFVGATLFGGAQLAFNAGMIGTGYAHAGVLGVALYCAVFGQVIKLLDDMLDAGVPQAIALAVMLPPLRTAIADSELTSALLSHGILIAIILLFVHGSNRAVARRLPPTAGKHRLAAFR